MQKMQETPVPSPSREDPLEEEMATHSSILAREIPWIVEPGRLQSMGSKSWTQLRTHTCMAYHHSLYLLWTFFRNFIENKVYLVAKRLRQLKQHVYLYATFILFYAFIWGGNGNPLQYSCLENSMDRGPWQITVNKVAKSWTQLSN